MGTRCVTVVEENNGDAILAMYRQMDGYPDGHGQELADFLRGKQLVNGISMSTSQKECFNGMGCLAASLVAHFKRGIGSFYIVPPNGRREEYSYFISGDASRIKLRVESGQKTIFDGYADDFRPEACQNTEEE